VGTQMIAKGLDFPNVTLVGVISADLNLNMPDFRASERTFQLITQVAGRAGRGDILGRVVVQTYEPSHFAIVASEKHDYSSFYSQEIAVRKAFFYPPYSRLINIIFTGTKENETIQAAKNFVDRLKNKMVDYKIEDHQVVFGPQPAPLSKIKQKYRWQIIIKSKSAVLDRFKDIIKDISLEDEENNLFNNVRLSVDIDPYSML
jgi:primosomal protein N' (replication factor Y)